MRSKKLVALAGAALAALLLVSAIGATAVFAQEPEPDARPALPFRERMGGPRGFGRGMPFGEDGELWARFDTLAEALGLTPEELFAETREGKTIEEIAVEQGVDLEALREEHAAEHRAEREQTMREAIAQAVEDGKMSEEQAEWLLEGLDNGYLAGLRGLLGTQGPGIRGRGAFGRFPGAACADDGATPSGTSG